MSLSLRNSRLCGVPPARSRALPCIQAPHEFVTVCPGITFVSLSQLHGPCTRARALVRTQLLRLPGASCPSCALLRDVKLEHEDVGCPLVTASAEAEAGSSLVLSLSLGAAYDCEGPGLFGAGLLSGSTPQKPRPHGPDRVRTALARPGSPALSVAAGVRGRGHTDAWEEDHGAVSEARTAAWAGC